MDGDDPKAAAPRRAAAGVLAAFACVALVAAGLGWLYLLRHASAFGAGPRLADALPLERLAGHGSQPVVRLVVAWLPTGLAIGVVLGSLTRRSRPARGLAAGAAAFVTLLLAGAVSDAVTASDPVGPHVLRQLGHGALWLATALVLAGALLTPSRSSRASRRPAGRGGATRPWAPERAAP